jgi:hypothetical protein
MCLWHGTKLNSRTGVLAIVVNIIEGEHLGSTYHATELRQDIDHANQVALDMGLDFRFKSQQPRVFI